MVRLITAVSFMKLNQLTTETLKTIGDKGSLQLLTKPNWNRLQRNFPAPGAIARMSSPNPANKEEKAASPCQLLV